MQEQVLAAQRCYLDGVREAARLNGEVEILRSQYAADLKGGKVVDATLAKQKEIQPMADRLSVQQEIAEDSAARLAAAENELKDARSFGFNARTLTDNLSAILAFAFVLAVIGSQVARLLFINLIYDKLEKPKKTEGVKAAAQDFDSLRANYLRYTEAYVGIVQGGFSGHIHYSPNYLRSGTDTLYAEVTGVMRPAENWRVSAHAGLFTRLNSVGPDGRRRRYDVRLSATREFRNMELNVGWSKASPRPAGTPQPRGGFTIGANVFFIANDDELWLWMGYAPARPCLRHQNHRAAD